MSRASELSRSAEMKLGRAKHHIGSLANNIDAFLAQRPFRLVLHVFPKLQEGAIRTKDIVPIPNDFSLIIGDAVHNLRSALDLTMYAMLCGRASKHSNIAFPFAKGAATIDGVIAKTETGRAGDKVVATVKQLQPYPGGHPVLSNLHELDIIDKHRLVILARRVTHLSAEEFSYLSGSNVRNGTLIFDVPGDGDLMRVTVKTGRTRAERRAVTAKGEFEQDLDLNPNFHIVFGDNQPFNGQNVVETLGQCAATVEGVISDLITAYLSPDNKFPA